MSSYEQTQKFEGTFRLPYLPFVMQDFQILESIGSHTSKRLHHTKGYCISGGIWFQNSFCVWTYFTTLFTVSGMDYKAENQHLLPKEISFIPSTLSQIHGKFEWVATTAKLVLNTAPTFPLATFTREDVSTMKMYLSFLNELSCLMYHPALNMTQTECNVLDQQYITTMYRLNQYENEPQDFKVQFDLSNVYLHLSYIRLTIVNILDTLGTIKTPKATEDRWTFFNHIRRALSTHCAMIHKCIPIMDIRLESQLELKYAIVSRKLVFYARYYSHWFL